MDLDDVRRAGAEHTRLSDARAQEEAEAKREWKRLDVELAEMGGIVARAAQVAGAHRGRSTYDIGKTPVKEWYYLGTYVWLTISTSNRAYWTYAQSESRGTSGHNEYRVWVEETFYRAVDVRYILGNHGWGGGAGTAAEQCRQIKERVTWRLGQFVAEHALDV